MNDLDTIRAHVDFLLERARRSDLSKEERQRISAEVNQLWTKLAAMTASKSGDEQPNPAASTQDEDPTDSDKTVRFVM